MAEVFRLSFCVTFLFTGATEKNGGLENDELEIVAYKQ